MTKFVPIYFLLQLSIITLLAKDKELVEYVNTLQGTNSSFRLTRGNTYPTTALPFGMHTWTPQTGKNGDGWKYQYDKKTIRGVHLRFSFPKDSAAFLVLDGYTGVSGLKIYPKERKITGYVSNNKNNRGN